MPTKVSKPRARPPDADAQPAPDALKPDEKSTPPPGEVDTTMPLYSNTTPPSGDYLLKVMLDVRVILADIRDILARKGVDYRREGF